MMNLKILSGFLSCLFSVGLIDVGFAPVSATGKPIVIAHRGASGYRPEHTLMAYEMAIEQGADYIEPDLVVTKDGHFVARHDTYLSTTTNVAAMPAFAHLKRNKNGKEDWFISDFTLAEVKMLKAIQPRISRGQTFDGIEGIATLDEIVDLVLSKGGKTGLYIEIKQLSEVMVYTPDLVERLIAALVKIKENGIPIYLQCFEGDFLLKVASRKTSIPLIYLIAGELDKSRGWYIVNEELKPFQGHIAGYGINKALLVNKDGTSSGLLERLQRQGARVDVWTVRDDQVSAMFGNVQQELKALISLGVDGIFTDFPDTAKSVIKTMKLLKESP